MAKKAISKNSEYVRFDWAIKRVLRDTANKKVLEGLISVLVGRSVTIIEIIDSGNNKIRKEDKSNSVDVKAKMEDGIISDDTQDPCLQEDKRPSLPKPPKNQS